MALVHPGLGERLEALVNDVRAKEAEAEGNSPEVAALKAVLTYSILAMISLVSRDDGTSALDWEKADRTSEEEWAKGRTVAALGQTIALMHSAPVRTWPEVEELGGVLGLLAEDEDWDWAPEIVRLGGETGLTVERQRTSDGVANFSTPGGAVACEVYKARAPEVPLDGVSVYLVQRIGEDRQLLDEYALMVDDPYWGRRIQPGEFAPGPLEETFVMGWRVKGRVLHDGEPASGANVSLEGCCEAEGLGQARFWDSLEYNELISSDTLETYVEGALVYAPIMTDEEGRWSFVCPKGYGAMYQRDGDGVAPGSGETAPRTLKRLWAVYQGRKVELAEETEAVIDVLSGKLVVEG